MPTDQSSETTNGAGPDQGRDAEAVEVAVAAVALRPERQQKKVLIAVLVVHLILVRFTLRDLRRRPDAAVRGRSGCGASGDA